ncbi:hypothetical protein [Nodularia sp. NIES-3585]|nr:hypothetical protein [Nodularia sp. NIES-3585]
MSIYAFGRFAKSALAKLTRGDRALESLGILGMQVGVVRIKLKHHHS